MKYEQNWKKHHDMFAVMETAKKKSVEKYQK